MTTPSDSEPQKVAQEEYLKRLLLAILLSFPQGLMLKPQALAVDVQSNYSNWGVDILDIEGRPLITLIPGDPRAKNGTEEPSLIIR